MQEVTEKPSLTLEGLFELTRCPSRPLNLSRVLLPKLQINMDTVRFAEQGAEVSKQCQIQLTQILIMRLLKMHFLKPILDC